MLHVTEKTDVLHVTEKTEDINDGKDFEATMTGMITTFVILLIINVALVGIVIFFMVKTKKYIMVKRAFLI